MNDLKQMKFNNTGKIHLQYSIYSKKNFTKIENYLLHVKHLY